MLVDLYVGWIVVVVSVNDGLVVYGLVGSCWWCYLVVVLVLVMGLIEVVWVRIVGWWLGFGVVCIRDRLFWCSMVVSGMGGWGRFCFSWGCLVVWFRCIVIGWFGFVGFRMVWVIVVVGNWWVVFGWGCVILDIS